MYSASTVSTRDDVLERQIGVLRDPGGHTRRVDVCALVHVVPSREEAWSQSAVLGLGLGVPVVGTHVDGLVDTLSQSRGVTVADGSALFAFS